MVADQFRRLPIIIEQNRIVVNCRLSIQSHLSHEDNNRTKPPSATVLPDRSAGYWLGDRPLFDAAESLKLKLSSHLVRPGHTDFIIDINSPLPLSSSRIKHHFTGVLSGLMTYAAAVLTDVIVPVLPVAVFEIKADKEPKLLTPGRYEVRNRTPVDQAEIEEILEKFRERGVDTQRQPRHRLFVAMRRFSASMQQMDSVNRFLDLWHALELLIDDQTSSDQTTFARLLTARLEEHTGKNESVLLRDLVSPLQHTLDAVINHGLADDDLLQNRLQLLEAVVLEVIRNEFEIPYLYNAGIEQNML